MINKIPINPKNIGKICENIINPELAILSLKLIYFLFVNVFLFFVCKHFFYFLFFNILFNIIKYSI